MSGGRGSNQYQTRPGGGPGDRRRDTTAIAGAVDRPADGVTVEEVAWRFHPDRRNWDYFQVPAADQFDWQLRGFEPRSAAEWRRAGVRRGFEAEEWSGAGFTATDAELWLRSLAVNTGFYGDPCPQYPWDHASQLARQGFSPTEIGEAVAGLWAPDEARREFLRRWRVPSVSQAAPRTWRWAHVDADRDMEQAVRDLCEQVEQGQIHTKRDFEQGVIGVIHRVASDYHVGLTAISDVREFTRWFLQVSSVRLFNTTHTVE